MSFSTAQLATMVTKAKLYMRLADDDEALLMDGIACFCDATDATAATVQVTDTTWVGIITGGASAGTTTKTFANATDDTLGELATTIDAVSGWAANLLGNSDANSTLLIRQAATTALGQAQENVLRYENEELLELLITNALDVLETDLAREIMSASYTERYELNGDPSIILRQPEVTAITRLAIDLEDGLTVKYTGTDESARVEVTDAAVKTISRTGATTTTTTSTFAANVTTTAMATTIDALAGWDATVKNARPSAFLVRTPARDAKNTEVTLEVYDDSDLEYEADYSVGIVQLGQRVWAERGWVWVEYTAGYATLPSDIEQVLLEMVKTAWDAGRRDASLTSERLGDYAYTIADASKAAMADALDHHERVIGKYRRVLM